MRQLHGGHVSLDIRGRIVIELRILRRRYLPGGDKCKLMYELCGGEFSTSFRVVNLRSLWFRHFFIDHGCCNKRKLRSLLSRVLFRRRIFKLPKLLGRYVSGWIWGVRLYQLRCWSISG